MSKLDFKELKQRKWLKMPNILDLTYVSDYKDWFNEFHTHDNCCEIMFVEEGDVTYCIDGQEYDVSTGDVIVVNQGLMHAQKSCKKPMLSIWICAVQNILLQGLPENCIIPEGKRPVLRAANMELEVKRCFHMLEHECLSRQAYAGEMIQLELSKLLMSIQRLTSPYKLCSIHRHGKTLSYSVKEYIDAHFSSRITLQNLSQVFHVSPYYLSHEMKRDIGIAPISYLINCRIGEAQRLLLSTDWSVTAIARMVGYQDISYFINLFHCRVGSTPQKFRQNIRLV